MLAATIKRIENKTYDKILARQVEPGEGWNTRFDYQDRGSGVKDAILANYCEIRRIPGVKGIREEWWLKGLIAEVLIFVPMNGAEKLSDHSGTRH